VFKCNENYFLAIYIGGALFAIAGLLGHLFACVTKGGLDGYKINIF